MTDTQKIIVLGAGVSGLSSGILLLRAGYEVEIWAKDFSPHTTSDKAGAFWEPFKAGPRDKVAIWAEQTLDYSLANLIGRPEAGCTVRQFQSLSKVEHTIPWWGQIVGDLEHSLEGLPAGYQDSITFRTVVFDTSIYMKFLNEEFIRLGGILQPRCVSTIDEPFQQADIVVNCTGLGSRELFADTSIEPWRGQTAIVKPNGFDRVVLDEKSMMLIVPRTNDIVLGATVQAGDSNLDVEQSDSSAILDRVRQTYPGYVWEVLDEKVGLRPVRASVRLEKEQIREDKIVVHNYGHGGAGYTLSWGCATEVVDLCGSSKNGN